MVEQNEEDAKLEDLQPELSDIGRYPLCVLEVGNLDAQIE